MRGLAALAVFLLLAGPVLAGPAAPVVSPLLQSFVAGVLCSPQVTGSREAPGTLKGVVMDIAGTPRIVAARQQLPAVIGLSMGITFDVRTDLLGVELRSWRPGRDEPEAWTGDFFAGSPNYNGFSFDTSDELVTGIWRFEAWKGPLLLYRVEFEVLSPQAMPGLADLCQATS
jgi:hypothetical protein